MPKFRIWDDWKDIMLDPRNENGRRPLFFQEADGDIWTWNIQRRPGSKPRLGEIIERYYDEAKEAVEQLKLDMYKAVSANQLGLAKLGTVCKRVTYAPEPHERCEGYTYKSRYLIMSCTQIEDCTGREIYEGDILHFYDAKLGRKKRKCLKTLNVGHQTMFMLEAMDLYNTIMFESRQKTPDKPHKLTFNETIQIIGNIYETPRK